MPPFSWGKKKQDRETFFWQLEQDCGCRATIVFTRHSFTPLTFPTAVFGCVLRPPVRVSTFYITHVVNHSDYDRQDRQLTLQLNFNGFFLKAINNTTDLWKGGLFHGFLVVCFIILKVSLLLICFGSTQKQLAGIERFRHLAGNVSPAKLCNLLFDWL